MAGVGEAEAAIGRSGAAYDAVFASPSIDPWLAESANRDAAHAPRCPEINCVRTWLDADVIEAAERRAAALGVGADRVLIAGGQLSEEDYLRALAFELGVTFQPLDIIPRDLCPLTDERLIESAAAGMLPLTIGDELCLTVAPRCIAARRITHLIGENPARARRFRFTTSEQLNSFVLRHGNEAIAARAVGKLKETWPAFSAAPPRWRANIATLVIGALLTLSAIAIAPAGAATVVGLTLAAVFLAWLGLRFAGVFLRPLPSESMRRVPDDELPVYTIVAALYREASSVDGLLAAIGRLDYPIEKLDVVIAVEADDEETREALMARKTRMPVTVIPVPARGPRTKPKALNVALPFARGAFTVIYDAEDRPEPAQLRRALHAFHRGSDDLACVQSRLCVDNTADSWLARLFTAEYAGQFDVFLPGIARLALPLPLGGSSNHFYTATLRAVCGWDPYNVTEDADLGMRLARFGYRSSVIDSTTYEEAPAHLGPWLRQRTRWFKGWMQTWLVHMRHPARLLRDLSLPGFLAFQLIVGGNALAALVHPLFIATLIYSLVRGAPVWQGDGTVVAILAAFYGTTAITGYLISAFLGWLGLRRRGLLSSAWVLLFTPLHWLLLSLAAWRALYQLIVAPYAWEKTEHGLAKSSRLAERMTRSLLSLERYLSGLTGAGDRPALAPDAPHDPLKILQDNRRAAK